ncbi:hypothetical protein [Streptomyces sp. NPDC017230]
MANQMWRIRHGEIRRGESDVVNPADDDKVGAAVTLGLLAA